MQDSFLSSKRIRVDFNLENYDEIRRFYLQKGSCQPVLQNHDYPLTNFSGKPRQFRFEWYVNRNWLEYSIDKDALFCLYYYLFGQDVGKQGGCDTFLTKGFKF